MVLTRLRLAALLVAASAATTPLAGQWRADARTGLVVGQVVDGTTGAPISGATVSFGEEPRSAAVTNPPPPAAPRILTGPSGRFIFRDLPPGSFSVTATKPGFLEGVYGRFRPDGPSRRLELAAGERNGDVTIRLWRTATITGTVVDATGDPIVGALVRSCRRVLRGGRRQFECAGVIVFTDDRGIYRLTDLLPGEYLVQTLQAPLDRPSSQVGPGFPIPPPSPDGSLWAYPATFYPASRAAGAASVLTIGSGEERPGIDFILQPTPARRVSGVVLTAQGQPAPTTLALTVGRGADIGLIQTKTTSDFNGNFTFPMVPVGEYTVSVSAGIRGVSGESWALLPLQVGHADIDRWPVVLQRGLSLSGTFQFDGSRPRPDVSKVMVTLEWIDPSGADSRRSFGGLVTNGTFTLPGEGPGQYLVRADNLEGWVFRSALYNGRDISTSPVDLRANISGIVLTFNEAAIGVTGVVRTARGEPDSSATVAVFPADATLWVDYGVDPRLLKTARAGKDGRYRILPLPPGEYYVVALSNEDAADWPDPRLLERLTGTAERVTLANDSVLQDLTAKRRP